MRTSATDVAAASSATGRTVHAVPRVAAPGGPGGAGRNTPAVGAPAATAVRTAPVAAAPAVGAPAVTAIRTAPVAAAPATTVVRNAPAVRPPAATTLWTAAPAAAPAATAVRTAAVAAPPATTAIRTAPVHVARRAPAASAPARLRWRLLRDDPLPGARNMALDHALALTLREGAGVLRLYGWSRPTVSFGRNEPASGVYDAGSGDSRGLDFVRRPTGGRAVLHEHELTYSVVVPLRALGGPREAYRRINEALAAGLSALGVDVEVAERGTAHRPDAGPCFQEAAPGEVVVNGRKLVGSAQARVGPALLQHGSIVLRTDQSALERLLCAPAVVTDGAVRDGHALSSGPSPDPPRPVPAAAAGPAAAAAATIPAVAAATLPAAAAATLPAAPAGEAAVAGDPVPAPAAAAGAGMPDHVSIDQVAGAVAMSVMRALGGGWAAGEYAARELRRADELEAEVYGRESWTWRR